MFDPFSLLAGGVLIGIGYFFGQIRKRTKSTDKSIKAICGCSHPLALHHPETHVCNGQIQRPHYMKSGTRNGMEWVSCSCKQYQGPKPADEFFTNMPYIPPISDS